MNIFELTRILNERYSEFTKGLTPTADKLEKIAKKEGKESEVNEFLVKINNLLLKKTDEFDSNSLYARIKQRLSGFIGGSNENDTNTLNDILSSLTNDMMELILSQSSDTVLELKNAALGPKKLELANYFGYKLNGRGDANKNIKSFLTRMKDFKPGSAGPYEVLLCLLFNGTKVEQGKDGSRGDIMIGGEVFEVKGHNGGCIDTGLDDLQLKMKTANGGEMKELMNDLNKAKRLFEVLDSKGTKLMEQFAKKLSAEQRQKLETNIDNAIGGNNGMTSNDIESYFSLLDDEGKKRAVIYGFYQLGYRNLIICKNDAMFNARVLFDDDMVSIYEGRSNLRDYGIDIRLSSQVVADENGVRAKTANFGSFIMQVI